MRPKNQSTPDLFSEEIDLKFLKKIIDLLPGHVYWKSTNLNYLGCNLQQANSLGFSSASEIVGKTDYDFSPEAEAKAFEKVDRSIIKTGNSVEVEEEIILQNGCRATVLSKKVPFFDENGNIAGLIGLSIDITERKRVEEAVRIAKEKAEAADQAKTSFIRDMGHDFRTPVGQIQGLTTIILSDIEDSPIISKAEQVIKDCQNILAENLEDSETRLNQLLNDIKTLKEDIVSEFDDKKDLLVACNQSSERVLGFFNEILILAESASGALKNQPVEADVGGLILFLRDIYLPGALKKKIELITKVDDKAAAKVLVDEAKLKRILMNLLGNSVKFTDEGRITLTAKLDRLEGKKGNLIVIVSDTAGGIPQDKLNNIFGAFTQLSEADRGRGGYGLGLNILKNYLNTIGGKVSVESKLGEGTDFVIEVPVELIS